MTVKISLNSRKHKDLFAIVDDIDSDLSLINWSAHNQGYAQRSVTVEDKATTVLMHRIIMERILGRPLVRGEVVDHIDHDVRNNVRTNLRLADQSRNLQNGRTRKTSISGYKGVWFDKATGLWKSSIYANGKLKTLGKYQTREEAARVYNQAALEYFGEFACLNVIPGDQQDQIS